MKPVFSRTLPGRRSWRDLLHDRAGAGAIELALVFPFMMVMFFGCVEVTQIVRVYMGLGVATEAMADLLSHGDPDTSVQVTDACNGAMLVMAPFNAGTFNAAIADVKNNSGTLSVAWHDHSCGNANQMQDSTATTLATGLVPNNGDEVIIVQTGYTYAAATSYVMPASQSYSYTAIARPRIP